MFPVAAVKGSEVSELISRRLLEFLTRQPTWDGDLQAAVRCAFKQLDEYILTRPGQQELKQILAICA